MMTMEEAAKPVAAQPTAPAQSAEAVKKNAEPRALKATAKAVIQIWLWGGPSQLETFDPKPDAGREYFGQYPDDIETNVSGIRICKMLPELAKIADKYTIIRGMTHGDPGHETAA